jgi:short-subunit dehydrogenase
MPELDVTGATSVITGAASGMGAEVARQLARRGARIALVDRNPEGLTATTQTLEGTGHTTHVVDLADDTAVAALAEEVSASHPHVQTLITCAGSSMLGSIDQLTMEEMRWLMDVNLWGTVNVTQALLPALRRAPAAHITHLVSIYGLAAPAGRIPYAMSKYAVRGFTEALRHELEDGTVTVGAIYPAGVKHRRGDPPPPSAHDDRPRGAPRRHPHPADARALLERDAAPAARGDRHHHARALTPFTDS